MRTVEVPGGQAILREQADLRGRDRRCIVAATAAAAPAIAKLPDDPARADGETEADWAARREAQLAEVRLTRQEAEALLDLKEAAAVALLASWTLEQPLPTLETIGDLPADLYDALVDSVGGAPSATLSAAFAPSPPGSDTPFGDSASSNGRSPDGPPSLPTPRRRNAGGSIATADSIPA